MDYYCDVRLENIKHRSKYKDFKSKSQEEFDKCNHILLSLRDVDINHINEAFDLYIIKHNKNLIIIL